MDIAERRQAKPSTSIADMLHKQWAEEWRAKDEHTAHMHALAQSMYKDLSENYYHLQEPMGKFEFYPHTLSASGRFNRKTRDIFASGGDDAEAIDTITHELFHAKYAEKGHPDYEAFKSAGSNVNNYHREPPEVWRETYAQRLPSVGPPDTVRWSNEEELADIAANEFIKSNFPTLKAPYAEQVAKVLQKDSGSEIGAMSSDTERATTPGLLQEIELTKSKHLPSVKQPPLWYVMSSILKGHGL